MALPVMQGVNHLSIVGELLIHQIYFFINYS